MFNWVDALCYSWPSCSQSWGCYAHKPPIGRLVGVKGVIASESRSLKLVGDRLIIFVLVMCCAFSAMQVYTAPKLLYTL